MRITTWNVNGVRAVLNKGAGEWIKSYHPDVLCLQEIKARPDQLTEDAMLIFDGYHAFWNPAQRPGYSGVATFSQTLPVEQQAGTGQTGFRPGGAVDLAALCGFYII